MGDELADMEREAQKRKRQRLDAKSRPRGSADQQRVAPLGPRNGVMATLSGSSRGVTRSQTNTTDQDGDGRNRVEDAEDTSEPDNRKGSGS